MSVYATIYGTYKYSNRESYERAVIHLKQGGWLNDDGFWLNELKKPYGSPNALDDKNLMITIHPNYYRNLLQQLKDIKKDAEIDGKWASTDGMFCGGFLKDTKTIDLTKWASENNNPEPSKSDFESEDDYWQDHVEWQNEVVDEFFES